MIYQIIISKDARKELKQIPAHYVRLVIEHLDKLAANPRPQGAIKLKGYQNEYRIRVGVYRILYTINDRKITVEVIKIGHRKDVYE